jgi:hypothetical protein
VKLARDCGFDTLFMTIYPLWGRDWWEIPAARGLIKDALEQARGAKLRVHLGLSLFNAEFCGNPARYPGASRTIQCDGTRRAGLFLRRCAVEDLPEERHRAGQARRRKSAASSMASSSIPKPTARSVISAFATTASGNSSGGPAISMPAGLVKPDAWLHAAPRDVGEVHGRMARISKSAGHARELREPIHAVNPNLQLSSLLWDYPVAVGVDDPRQQYFRMLAIGLGTKDKPSWTLPEHTSTATGPTSAGSSRKSKRISTPAGAGWNGQGPPRNRLLRPRRGVAARARRNNQKLNGRGLLAVRTGGLEEQDADRFRGRAGRSPAKYVDALSAMNRAVRQHP